MMMMRGESRDEMIPGVQTIISIIQQTMTPTIQKFWRESIEEIRVPMIQGIYRAMIQKAVAARRTQMETSELQDDTRKRLQESMRKIVTAELQPGIDQKIDQWLEQEMQEPILWWVIGWTLGCTMGHLDPDSQELVKKKITEIVDRTSMYQMAIREKTLGRVTQVLIKNLETPEGQNHELAGVLRAMTIDLQTSDSYVRLGSNTDLSTMKSKNTEVDQKTRDSGAQSKPSEHKIDDLDEFSVEVEIQSATMPRLDPPLKGVSITAFGDSDTEMKQESSNPIVPSILTDEARYQQYIQQTQPRLQYGDWLSFSDNKLEPTIYETYQEAVHTDSKLPGWFCREYRGLDPVPYELDALVTHGNFQFKARAQGYRTAAAYVNVEIFKPGESKGLKIPMKIDTGADITYSSISSEILALGIIVPAGKEEYSRAWGVGGPVDLQHLNVEIQVGELDRRPLKVACPRILNLVRETEEKNEEKEKRLLGQSFLKMCRHTWTRGTQLEIELLSYEFKGPVITTEASISEMASGIPDAEQLKEDSTELVSQHKLTESSVSFRAPQLVFPAETSESAFRHLVELSDTELEAQLDAEEAELQTQIQIRNLMIPPVPIAPESKDPSQIQPNRSVSSSSEPKRLSSLEHGQLYYEQYVQQHLRRLQVRDWICLYDNDYSTAQHFHTYEAAAAHYRGHKIRYCKQYYGPHAFKEIMCPAVHSVFGPPPQGRHPMLAYVEARIFNPADPTLFADVDFMIDTGATKCKGRHDVLVNRLNLIEEGKGESIMANGEAANLIYTQVKVALRDLNDPNVYLAAKVVQIGYYERQNPEITANDWLLGQNFLGYSRHIWINNTGVKIALN